MTAAMVSVTSGPEVGINEAVAAAQLMLLLSTVVCTAQRRSIEKQVNVLFSILILLLVGKVGVGVGGAESCSSGITIYCPRSRC